VTSVTVPVVDDWGSVSAFGKIATSL